MSLSEPPRHDEVVTARLVVPPPRRAAPLAAWLMFTAMMATLLVPIGPALANSRNERDDLLSAILYVVVGGGGLGMVIGGLSGLFDSVPMRGGLLGAATGAAVGMTTIAATTLSPEQFALAFSASALGSLGILAAAITGRWVR